MRLPRLNVLALALCLATPLLPACSDTDVGVTVTTHFCRQSANCDEELETIIDSAQTELQVAVYTFNREELAEALCRASERGVQVWVVMETSQRANRKAYEVLSQCEGLSVRCDGNSDFMHHKFVIADRQVVTTGSYNFTDQATFAHDENLVVLRSSGVAEKFVGEFTRITDLSQACNPDVWN